jgi:hypothetical protein
MIHHPVLAFLGKIVASNEVIEIASDHAEID